MSKMSKQQFIGHMFCDMRFKQINDMIKYHPIDRVQMIYELHLSMPKNVRYNQLQKLFEERFIKENGQNN